MNIILGSYFELVCLRVFKSVSLFHPDTHFPSSRHRYF